MFSDAGSESDAPQMVAPLQVPLIILLYEEYISYIHSL